MKNKETVNSELRIEFTRFKFAKCLQSNFPFLKVRFKTNLRKQLLRARVRVIDKDGVRRPCMFLREVQNGSGNNVVMFKRPTSDKSGSSRSLLSTVTLPTKSWSEQMQQRSPANRRKTGRKFPMARRAALAFQEIRTKTLN